MYSPSLLHMSARTVYPILILAVTVMASGCAQPAQPECMQLPSGQQSPLLLEVVSQEIEDAKNAAFQTIGAQELWQQKASFLSPESGWAGWVTQLAVFPSQEIGKFLENPVLLTPEEQIRGFFLVRNSWQMPHTLRVIFLLDFQQVPVLVENRLNHFYDFPKMDPQEDRAFEFILPGLPEGFHQLSILLVADPENYSTDSNYRFLQQMSFTELRYDLWVGIDSPSQEVPRFENPEIGQAAASRLGSVELVLSAQDPENNPVLSLAMSSGKQYCVNLRLFNSTPQLTLYGGSVDLRIAVFWNDELTQVLDYTLSADAPEKLTLQLAIGAPLEIDTYQFSIVVFTYPGYSQFTIPNKRTGYPVGAFTRRVVVEVQP